MYICTQKHSIHFKTHKKNEISIVKLGTFLFSSLHNILYTTKLVYLWPRMCSKRREIERNGLFQMYYTSTAIFHKFSFFRTLEHCSVEEFFSRPQCGGRNGNICCVLYRNRSKFFEQSLNCTEPFNKINIIMPKWPDDPVHMFFSYVPKNWLKITMAVKKN